MWSETVAAQSAPALISGQSNPPADVVSGIAGVNGGGFATSGYTLGAYPGFSNPSQLAQAVVARYDSSGTRMWLTQFGAGSGDFLEAVTTDSSGDIYVAGATNGTYSSKPNSTGIQSLVAKFSPAGSRLWIQSFAISSGMTSLSGVAVDSVGGVEVIGTSVLPNTSQSVAFVAHVDAGTGALGWVHQYGNFTSTLNPTAITAGLNGDVYVVGSNLSAASASQQTTDVVHLDGGTGSQLWLSTLAPSGEALLLTSVAMNSDGNPVVAGAASTKNSLIVGFGADSFAHAYVAELSSGNGQSLWTTEPSTGSGDQITGLSATGNKLYAVGSTNGSFASVYQAQLEGVFLMRFSAAGVVEWVQQFGRGAILNVDTPSGAQVTTDLTRIYTGSPTQTGSKSQVAVQLDGWGM
jgi:hypothetical protein